MRKNNAINEDSFKDLIQRNLLSCCFLTCSLADAGWWSMGVIAYMEDEDRIKLHMEDVVRKEFGGVNMRFFKRYPNRIRPTYIVRFQVPGVNCD